MLKGKIAPIQNERIKKSPLKIKGLRGFSCFMKAIKKGKLFVKKVFPLIFLELIKTARNDVFKPFLIHSTHSACGHLGCVFFLNVCNNRFGGKEYACN